MEKIKLEYSKDWRNPTDFPAVETDEVRVREDLQYLYAEIQTFVNEKLIPAMESLEKPAIENLPTEDIVSGSKYKIPTSLAVSRMLSSSGNLPTGGTTGQFLVKDGADYGQAAWQTHAIPKRLSEVFAVGENAQPVDAQTYVDEAIEDVHDRVTKAEQDCVQNREDHAELIASGVFGFGTSDAQPYAVIELGDVSRYSGFFVEIKQNRDGRSDRRAALYLGRGKGEYKSTSYTDSSTGERYYRYSVVETGISHISNLATYGFNNSGRSFLAVYPFDEGGKALVSWENTRDDSTGGNTVISNGVETNVITIYARSHYYNDDYEDDGIRVNQYEIYGIRRGKKED
jgi:hypothetical protein